MTKPIACLRSVCPDEEKCWEAERCLHPMHALSPPEPTEGQAAILLNRAMVRLASAGIGSCTCETKNDDLAYHRGDCRARLIELAIRDLADARAAMVAEERAGKEG